MKEDVVDYLSIFFNVSHANILTNTQQRYLLVLNFVNQLSTVPSIFSVNRVIGVNDMTN